MEQNEREILLQKFAEANRKLMQANELNNEITELITNSGRK